VKGERTGVAWGWRVSHTFMVRFGEAMIRRRGGRIRASLRLLRIPENAIVPRRVWSSGLAPTTHVMVREIVQRSCNAGGASDDSLLRAAVDGRPPVGCLPNPEELFDRPIRVAGAARRRRISSLRGRTSVNGFPEARGGFLQSHASRPAGGTGPV